MSAFWNAEGVILRRRGVPTREFRVDDFGAPRYPEVVLFTTRTTLKKRRRMVQGVVRALTDGTKSVLADPGPAVREIARAGGADEELVRAQLEAVSPGFARRSASTAKRSSAGLISISASGSSSTASTCSALSRSI